VANDGNSTESRKIKVLLADDVRLELEIEKTFFQRRGFQVITAADGALALHLAKTEMPDLIVLDQVMPGLSGTEVCRQLKADPATSSIRVIVTSADEKDDLARACVAAGAEAFISKSAGREALLETAARILKVPQRKLTRLTICFTVQGVTGAREAIGKGVELSESGLAMETPRRYSVGDLLSLRFMIPGAGQEFHAQACVVEIAPRPDGVYSHALRFVEMNETDRSRLNQHIDRALSAR
jgi:CheY-like chemotaxis protein